MLLLSKPAYMLIEARMFRKSLTLHTTDGKYIFLYTFAM